MIHMLQDEAVQLDEIARRIDLGELPLALLTAE
jgi:hypothetical protein